MYIQHPNLILSHGAICFRGLLCLLLVNLIACAQNPQPPSEVLVDVVIEEPDRIRFSGKGAGAGMMLSASMGAMGIAIGVAIDEGIGKNIDESAKASGFDMQTLAREVFLSSYENAVASNNAFELRIHRYGFITQQGDNDPVAVELDVSITRQGEAPQRIKYPNDFIDESAGPLSVIPLDLAKSDGKASTRLLEEALAKVVRRYTN